MTGFLNKMISRWKGHNYKLDAEIPAAYLLRLLLLRAMMLCRGKISGIKNKGLLFFSWRATVKCRSKLIVGRAVTIEHGCYIDALSTGKIILGDNVSVGRNTKIIGTGHLQLLGRGLKVGNNVGLGTESFYGCGGGIEIGDDSIIGDFVSFHAENHNHDQLQIPIRLQEVNRQGIRIGKNCWIGSKATILDGVTIQDGCIIAAGAVVIAGLYSENCIYAGVPAKLIRTRQNQNK